MSIPADFFCTISHGMMMDPVVASDGHSYEKAEILKWFGQNMYQGHDIKSPLTNEILTSAHLVPNVTLKKLIDWWLDCHQDDLVALKEKVHSLKEKNKKLMLTTENQELNMSQLLTEQSKLKEQIVEQGFKIGKLSMEKKHLADNLSLVADFSEEDTGYVFEDVYHLDEGKGGGKGGKGKGWNVLVNGKGKGFGAKGKGNTPYHYSPYYEKSRYINNN